MGRADLEELFLDYEDFLRQRGFPLWEKDHPKAKSVRKLAYASNKAYIEKAPANVAANTMICLIHQANYLPGRQLGQLEKQFLDQGGFTEKLYQARLRSRKQRR